MVFAVVGGIATFFPLLGILAPNADESALVLLRLAVRVQWLCAGSLAPRIIRAAFSREIEVRWVHVVWRARRPYAYGRELFYICRMVPAGRIVMAAYARKSA